MQKTFIERASDSVQKPEVQQLIRELAKYDLGVCIPHMHDMVTGSFLPLPRDCVQSENGLKVSFVSSAKVGKSDIPVAWRWNDQLEVAATCHVCRPDGPHH